MAPSPTQSAVLTALRSFLLAILPSGVEVVQAQQNRVPEPKASNFVIMTPLLRTRLATNVDTYDDASFTGSISGATLDVTAVEFGVIEVGRSVFGAGVATGTTITALGTGTGGIGTYQVSLPQSVASQPLAAGARNIMSPMRVTIQLDFHSADASGADLAQTFTTLFRDAFAVEYFAAFTADVVPLYSGEPRQIPFVNDQQQWETRWTADAELQANQRLSLPQQFADGLSITTIPVEANYPA